MVVRRNLRLLFLYMAAANSLPNPFNDLESQNLYSDGIGSTKLDFLDMGLSEPQDSTNLYTKADQFPSISDGTALANPGLDWTTTSTYQGSTEDEWIGSIAGFDDSEPTLSFPTSDSKVELAMDDICPIGYWNRCCNFGYCFWGMYVETRRN